MLLFRLRSSIGKASEVIRRNSMVNASEVLPLHHRALLGNVTQVSRVLHSYSRNSQTYLAQYLDKQIKLTESRCIRFPTIHPGCVHATLVKIGAGSDQLLCKMLRFYASSGYLRETAKFFNDAYFSNKAGLGVWNCYIISLAIHGQEFEGVPRALTVFENMPTGMVKTHATYWNAMVAAGEASETKYAQYLLAKVFKALAVEPSLQITGAYIEALVRKGEMEKAFTEFKSMVYQPNQEIIVSILSRFDMHPDPVSFADQILSYVESKGATFYMDKATIKKLTGKGVTLNPCVKTKRGRSKGGSVAIME